LYNQRTENQRVHIVFVQQDTAAELGEREKARQRELLPEKYFRLTV